MVYAVDLTVCYYFKIILLEKNNYNMDTLLPHFVIYIAVSGTCTTGSAVIFVQKQFSNFTHECFNMTVSHCSLVSNNVDACDKQFEQKYFEDFYKLTTNI